MHGQSPDISEFCGMTFPRVVACAGFVVLAGCTTTAVQSGQDFAPVNHDLDALSNSTTNEQVKLPGGQTARIESVWLSALGQQCMRITITPAQTTEVACHGATGWYTMRDVTRAGGS
jgi:hypothetical protein